MKKKKEITNVVWSVNSSYKASNTIVRDPLYTVNKVAKEFVVMYHGVCAIHSSKTLEDAQEYIRNALAKYQIQVKEI